MIQSRVHGWLGQLILVDVVLMGSCAHQLWWLWTNIVPPKLFQQTYHLVPQPKGFTMDAILDLRCVSQVVCHDDWPPLVIVNKASQPWASLPTIMNILGSHVFYDDGLGMIWDSRHSCWWKLMLMNGNMLWGFMSTPLVSLFYLKPLEDIFWSSHGLELYDMGH